MRRRKKSHTLINQMNVVPYIDVMLVLLIIFMVTAPMFVPGVINLPSVGKSTHVTMDPIQITVSHDGIYSIIKKNQTTNVPNLDTLVAKLQTMMTLDSPIVISADRDTKYNSVIQVVDKLYSAGIKKVALVVKEKNG